MTTALDRSEWCRAQSLAAYSPVYHYMWNGLLAYWWMELQGAFCLFAQSPDGWFMPLPPIGAGSIDAPLSVAMGLLRRWNGDSPVSRVENVPSQLVPELERLGYRLTPKEPDYLYRATDLAALVGDRYKSQRALCNRFEREQSFEIDFLSGQRPPGLSCPPRALVTAEASRKGSNRSGSCCWLMRRRLMKSSGRRRRSFESRGGSSGLTVGCAPIPSAIG